LPEDPVAEVCEIFENQTHRVLASEAGYPQSAQHEWGEIQTSTVNSSSWITRQRCSSTSKAVAVLAVALTADFCVLQQMQHQVAKTDGSNRRQQQQQVSIASDDNNSKKQQTTAKTTGRNNILQE